MATTPPRSVVAIDTTVFFASVVRIVESEERPRCASVVTREIADNYHHPAAEAAKHTAFATRIVESVLGGGTPTLVVLRKPNFSTITATPPKTRAKSTRWNMSGDASAIRRIGVHWELVRLFSEKNIPVAEVSLDSVERGLTGKTTRGYDALAAKCQTMFPDAVLPTHLGKPDPRWRWTTLALAMAGLPAIGVPLPEGVDRDQFLAGLAKGNGFPPRFTPSSSSAGYAAQDSKIRDVRKTNHEDWIEEQKKLIRSLPVAELEAKGRPRNAVLRKAWDKRVNAEV